MFTSMNLPTILKPNVKTSVKRKNTTNSDKTSNFSISSQISLQEQNKCYQIPSPRKKKTN